VNNGSGGVYGMPGTDLAKQSLKRFDDAAKDPAFQQPVDATDADTKARAKLIYRDLPLVTIQNTWTVEQVRGAIYSHMTGVFDSSAQLWDSILGDDRVTATLNSRATALFGREVRFKAANDSDAAKETLRAWQDWWPRFAGDSGLREMSDYGIGMGFSHAQLVWGQTKSILGPYIRPWHSRFEYYHWPLRRFIALSQDGPIAITPGDGKWLEHAPYGSYRGWIRGALRPVAEPWMLRHWGFRDMARFSEVHGQPTRVGRVPSV
jgi:phage gp29-like protein